MFFAQFQVGKVTQPKDTYSDAWHVDCTPASPRLTPPEPVTKSAPPLSPPLAIWPAALGTYLIVSFTASGVNCPLRYLPSATTGCSWSVANLKIPRPYFVIVMVVSTEPTKNG